MSSLAAAPVSPIPAHSVLILLVQLCVLLVAARGLGSLALRCGLPRIVGELSAGILVGPSVLGHLAPEIATWLFPVRAEQQHLLDAVGQIGVLLLVGLAGTHLDIGYIRTRAGTAAKVSGAGLVLPLALGVGVGLLAPVPLRPAGADPIVFALFLGVALCVSAIPVIAKTLRELNLLHRNIGQLILTAGTIDDAVGWLLLSVVAALAVHGLTAATVFTSIGWLVAVLAVALLVGRPLVRFAIRRARAGDESTRVTAVVVVVLLVGAAATQSVGFEAILGAFVCGVLIRSAGAPAALLQPLDTTVLAVLAPIYFATAGLRMDLSALAEPRLLGISLLILATAVAGKFAGAFLGGYFSGLTRRECVALGAGMNARGVIEVIIAMVGLRMGVLGAEAYTALVLVAVITSVMAPPILRWSLAAAPVTAEEENRRTGTTIDPESVGERASND
ncbi:cation:proton antiporter [Nocardia goodfellowii]